MKVKDFIKAVRAFDPDADFVYVPYEDNAVACYPLPALVVMITGHVPKDLLNVPLDDLEDYVKEN